MRNILFIVNPISGTANKTSLKELITTHTQAAGIRFSIYPSVANGDYSFLHPVIKEEKVTDVVIAGGDGTINQAVNNLKKLDVQFGIIPMGSGNGLAFSAGIPKDPAKALKIIFKGEYKWTDAFLINGSFACMLCGLGFDAKVAHDFANAPKRGLTTYVQKTISNFVTAKFYPFTITTNDRKIRTDAFFITIANSNQFGNHFTIAPKASLTDGMLDVVIMTKQSKLNILFQVIKQITGFNKVTSVSLLNDKASLIYFQAKEITVKNKGSAPLHIDGDPVETMEEMKFKILPNSFKLIYP
jgi:YegS/Rv2252/BmrU family lipid kinase